MPLLSSSVRVVADAGEEYGVIDDVEKFCNKAINAYLGPKAGYLVGTPRDEMLSWLFEVVARCVRTYDPAAGKRFKPYVWERLGWRVTDKYRKDGGDRRYKPRPVQESIDDRNDEIGGAHDLGHRVALLELSSGLTPVARMTLHKIVRAQQLGIPDEEIAEHYGWTRRQLSNHLRTLRQELPRRDLAA